LGHGRHRPPCRGRHGSPPRRPQTSRRAIRARRNRSHRTRHHVSNPVPVPLDVTELVARLLRSRLTDHPEVKISTEIGHGVDGGPPSLPWLLVADDGHTWQWPAVQRVVIRLTSWHHTPHSAKALAGLALGLLCTPPPPGVVVRAEPVSGPVAAVD